MRTLLPGLAALAIAAGCFPLDREPQANARPVAVATALLQTLPGETVVLDGSASRDDDGDPLTYRWAQVEGQGIPVTLAAADSKVATFVAPARGQTLYFRLTVHDGYEDSEPALVEVRVNGRPVADAGPSKEVVAGGQVQLDGSGHDDDGDTIVSFSWKVETVPAGAEECLAAPSPCLTAADTAWPSFRAPTKGSYLLSLVVGDGRGLSLPDLVNVRAGNRAPLARPQTQGPAQVANHAAITLDASGSSDPDGDALTSYQWAVVSQPPGAAGVLEPADGSSATPTFTPHGKGSYFLGLTVVDAEGASSPIATLRVEATNTPPTADAGAPASVQNGTELYLLGSARDADGDALQYAWKLLDHPPGGEVVLRDPASASVHFTPQVKTATQNPAACQPGQCYVLGLTAFDGVANSEQSRVVVTVGNRPPLADAGPDQTLTSATLVLDGTASRDPDGDALTTYTWTQVTGADLTSGKGSLSGPQLTLTVPVSGTYSFDLVVRDAEAPSQPDRVVVQVPKLNAAPVVSVPARFILAEGTVGTLDASSSADPDGDPITLTWRRVQGSSAFAEQLVGKTPSLTAPAFGPLVRSDSGENSAVYEVVASDGGALSTPQRTTVYVTPGTGFVVISDQAGAANTPTCGTLAAPCATLGYALGRVDTNNDGVGDGRHLVMTSGQWQETANAAIDGHVWKGGTSLFAGRDPVTFAPSTPSRLRIENGACQIGDRGFVLPTQVGTDVLLRGFRVSAHGGCGGFIHGLECRGCQARILDSEIVSSEGPAGVGTRLGVLVTGGAANLTLERTRVTVEAGTSWGRGVAVESGGKLVAHALAIKVSAVNGPGGDTLGVHHRGLDLVSGQAELRASTVEVLGAVTTGSERCVGIDASGGLVLENSVVANTCGGDAVGVRTDRAGSLVNDTLVGAGTSGNGAALRLQAAVDVMNTTLSGFPRGIWLDGPAALGSRLHGNALAAAGALAVCDGTDVSSLALLHAAPPSTCNSGVAAHAGNLAAACPLANASAGDYHLNDSVANECVDHGLAASPAGVAPATDLEGDARPGPSGIVDIGADEVGDR